MTRVVEEIELVDEPVTVEELNTLIKEWHFPTFEVSMIRGDKYMAFTGTGFKDIYDKLS